MEIKIKTMAEITDSRVTITITTGDQAQAEQVAEKITAEPGEDRVYGHLGPAVAAMTGRTAEVRERSFGEIRRRLGEREIQLSGAHKRIESLEQENAAYAREVDNLTTQRDGYDADRKTERQRADTNQARAERAEKHKKDLQEKLDDALKDVRRLTRVVESSRRSAAVREDKLRHALATIYKIQDLIPTDEPRDDSLIDIESLLIEFFAPPGPPAPPA